MKTLSESLRWVAALFLLCAAPILSRGQGAASAIVVSVPDQTLILYENGVAQAKYRISTSKFGLGDGLGSYRTPLGHLAVRTKIGEHFKLGTVLKGRSPTGEVLKPNAPGRDPIVTRIIWLEGREEQNRRAYERGIYIHGTTEESRLGSPVSWGCIRMASRDVAELFDRVDVGTEVLIADKPLSELRDLRPSGPVDFPAEPSLPSQPVRFGWNLPPRPDAGAGNGRGYPIVFAFRDLRCTGVLVYRAASEAENKTLDPSLIRLASNTQ